MDLIVTSYWKTNGETQGVARFPDTNYKSLDDLQKTLKARFKNKAVYWVKCTYDGIIVMAHSSLVAQKITLG